MADAIDLLDSLMRGGVKKSTPNRLEHSLGEHGVGGSGGLLEQIMGGLAAASESPSSAATHAPSGGRPAADGGIGDILGSLLGGSNASPSGSLGDLAGAILGGKSKQGKGAAGGGALAILGAIALKALQSAAAPDADDAPKGVPSKSAAPKSAAPKTAAPRSLPPIDPATRLEAGLRKPENPQEEKQLKSVAALMVKAMVNAAKADGRVDEQEIQRIVGNAKQDGIAAEAEELLDSELRQPMDTDRIARAAASPQIAAQVYAASLMAMDLDTAEEKKYLADLALKMRLDANVVKKIHSAVGAA